MRPVIPALLIFVAVTQASGSSCSGDNTCFYVLDPCPSGTEDCSEQYSCSMEFNKCCCIKTPEPTTEPTPEPTTKPTPEPTTKPTLPPSGCPEGWSESASFCYLKVEGTWGVMGASQGQQECQKIGATLPVIKSAVENDFLTQLLKEFGYVASWLGMEAPNGDNVFYWADGTSVAETFSAWREGQPNRPGIENCVYIMRGGHLNGKWQNAQCDNDWPTFCQKPK